MLRFDTKIDMVLEYKFLFMLKARLREEETAAAIEDVEVKGLELEAHRAALEQQVLSPSTCLSH